MATTMDRAGLHAAVQRAKQRTVRRMWISYAALLMVWLLVIAFTR